MYQYHEMSCLHGLTLNLVLAPTCYVVSVRVCTGVDMVVNVMWLVLGSVQGKT